MLVLLVYCAVAYEFSTHKDLMFINLQKVTKRSALLKLDKEIADLEEEYEAKKTNLLKAEKLLEKARNEVMAVGKKLEISKEKRSHIM